MQSEIPKLLALLKEQFKLRGVRYADIAERLGISVITVKRYLSGKGLSLSVLEKLCRAAGLHLSDLTELLLQDKEAWPGQLSLDQELSLISDLHAAFVFYLLRSGWTAQEIATEFGLNDLEIFTLLRSLERAGLISLMPRNRARVLTSRYPEWLSGGPVRKAIDRSMAHVFEAIRRDEEGSFHNLDTVKLTPRGLARVRQSLDHLAREVRAIAASDRVEPGGAGEWHSIMCVAQRLDPTNFFRDIDQTLTE